ncbi:MAG: histidine kinase [Betaproteobacteria bacterium]|nr:histidine kinase [Betaproteobacteria bacterium]
MNILCGFGKRHVLIALAFCIPVQFAHMIYALLEQKQLQWSLIATWMAFAFLFSLLGLACAVASDNMLGERVGTGVRMVVALLLAAVVLTVVSELLVYVIPAWMMDEEKKMMGDYAGVVHRIAFRFVTSGDTALLLIPLYMMVQASRRATQRLHDARLSAIATERNVVEADLRAMQARVEPELLFAALRAVDEAYARNVEEGERALDALIAFLRAALPAEPGSTSTVAAELDLVRAYVGVAELLSGPKLELEITAEPGTRANAMPAMLLLPLARWAMDGAAAALKLVARQGNGVLEISLRSDGAASSPRDTDDIAGVRERLEHLYGTRAKLEASSESHVRRAFIALPV